MNKVIFIGRLSKDVELRETYAKIPVAGFDLAVQRDYKNAEGEYDADFFKIIVWKKQAESCAKNLSKGDKVCIVGKIQNRSYENRGKKYYITEVTAENVEFLEIKKQITAV